MAVAPYATPLERAWYYTFRILCGLIFFFLIMPILVIIPLGFNPVPFFTYPMEGFSWRWYGEIFGDSPISILWQRSMVNSVVVAVCATLLASVLGTLAALGLTRANFPGKPAVMAILISPIMVPIVVIAVGMFYFYAQVGLVSTLTGIILAHTTLGVPFVVITVAATLHPVRVFRKVTLPIITPGVVSGSLFAFAASWDEIVVVLFLASTEQHTVPRRMWSGIRELLSPTIIAAATMLIIISILLIFTMEWLRRRSERMRGITPS